MKKGNNTVGVLDTDTKNDYKKSKEDKKKVSFGVKFGVLLLIIGLVILITSYAIYLNVNTDEQPRVNLNFSPKSIADTFSVPEDAKYDKSYHTYTYEREGSKVSYSQKLFSRHSLNKINFKMEGGTLYKLPKKTVFAAYVYNTNEESPLSVSIDIKFLNYNKTKAGSATYQVEELKPLESKKIFIDVDDKVFNAYDYEISIQ